MKLSVLTVATTIVICLVMLGNWQMQRLSWKLDLIEKVKSRAYSAPVPPPSGGITYENHAYMRIKLSGRYAHDKTLLVKAVTDLGLGYWVMTPLISADKTYWVNRGFISQKQKSFHVLTMPDSGYNVIGLLRISEPDGTFLEKNNAKKNRWFSRDVKVMSGHAGLDNAQPFFLDLEKSTNTKSWPRAGMTTLKFRNNHLPYALTWYAMAVLLTVAGLWVAREL